MIINKKSMLAFLTILFILAGIYTGENVVKANEKISFTWSNKNIIAEKKKDVRKKTKAKNSMDIVIFNKADDEVVNTIFTNKNNIVLKGEIVGVSNVKKVEIQYYHNNEMKSLVANGTEKWNATIPLKRGTNKIEIIARGTKKLVKSINVNMTNETVEYNIDFKKFENLDDNKLREGLITYRVSDSGTTDKLDDNIYLLVKEDSLLMEQVKNNILKEGELLSIKRSLKLPTGFLATYKGHQSPQSNEEYDVNSYSDEEYEELIFNYVGFDKLFKQDVSLNFSDGVDTTNPVAFSIIADDNIGTSGAISVTNSKDGKSNISLKLDNIKISEDTNSSSILSGELLIKELDFFGGMEWYKKEGKLLPEQLFTKIDYKTEGKISVKSGGQNLSEDIIRNMNKKFLEKKLNYLGISSVIPHDMKNKWLIGAIGLNLKSPSIEGIEKSMADVLKPTLVLLLYVDMNGKLSADTGFRFNYSSINKKGYNLQDKSFVGSFGSIDENKSDKHFDVDETHSLDIYDEDKGEFQLFLDKHANTTLTVGTGVSSSLMIGGLSPVAISSDMFYRSEVDSEDENKNIDLEKAKINYGVGARINVGYNVSNIDSVNYISNWEKMFWEKDPTMATVFGKVYNDKREELSNIQVNFKDKNGEIKQSVLTDEKGNYKTDEVKVGVYSIEIVDKNTGEFKYCVKNLFTFLKSGKNKFDITAKLDIPTYVNVVGEIRDSLDGNTVENITLEFITKQVKGYEAGVVLKSVITNSSGFYKMDHFQTGVYDVRIFDNSTRTNKYYEEKDVFVAIDSEDDLRYDFAVSRDLRDEFLRVILLWGDYPDDLDSHILGPNGEHVYYSNKYYADSIELDVDDTNGRGPETITLKNMKPGIYSYKVHNYTHGNEIYGKSLSLSKAKVIVKRGNITVGIYEVPKERVGTVWNVFRYNSVTGQIMVDDIVLPKDDSINYQSSYEDDSSDYDY